jgi:chromate reductase
LHHHVPRHRQILAISGSLRERSTNTALLRTAGAVSPSDVTMTLYGASAQLPQFNPDDDGEILSPVVAELRAQIGRADAVLFSTPEYAGGLPGSFKNVLDWAVGDDQPRSLSGKPVAFINVSPRGAVYAHEALRRVLGYLGAAVVESACIDLPLTQDAIDDDGLIRAGEVMEQAALALVELIRAIPSEERPGPA